MCLISQARVVWKEPDNAKLPGVMKSVLNGSNRPPVKDSNLSLLVSSRLLFLVYDP